MRTLLALLAGYVVLIALVVTLVLLLASCTAYVERSHVAPDKRITIENLSVAVDRELKAQEQM